MAKRKTTTEPETDRPEVEEVVLQLPAELLAEYRDVADASEEDAPPLADLMKDAMEEEIKRLQGECGCCCDSLRKFGKRSVKSMREALAERSSQVRSSVQRRVDIALKKRVVISSVHWNRPQP